MTTSSPRQLLRHHPLLAFFVLTYILTWALVLPFGVFFTAGPLLAAVTVVSLTRGRAGFAELGRRLIHWRVRAVWYALAVAVPVGVQLLTFGVNLTLGAGAPTSLAQLAPLSILGAFAVRLVNPLDGPLAEEPGWRAFAQPRLQLGRSRLSATLILAVLVTCWHLPLWLLPAFGATPSIIVADIFGTIAVTIWYSWLFNHSGGSALLTLIAHSVEGLVHPQLFWSDPAVTSQATTVYAVGWCLTALVLVFADRTFWSERSDQVQPTNLPGANAQQEPATRGWWLCLRGKANMWVNRYINSIGLWAATHLLRQGGSRDTALPAPARLVNSVHNVPGPAQYQCRLTS